MVDTDCDGSEKVGKWLSEQGCRLEYLAHHAFRHAGLRSLMGHYLQTAQGVLREIDVIAFPSSGKGTGIDTTLLCECKYSREKPWVMLTSNLLSQTDICWMATPKSRNVTLAPLRGGDIDSLSDCWHFPNGYPVGHALLQAFRKDNRDAAYEALQKIATSAWELCDERVSNVAFPCIVLDGPLYHAHLDPETQEFAVQQAEFGRMSWAGCRGGTMIDVVQVEALPKYAMAVTNTFETIRKIMR